MYKVLFYLLLISLLSCDQKGTTEPVKEAVEVEIMNFDELESQLMAKEGKTTVVNFWATWCKPCLEELPVFEALHDSLGDRGVEVILVSLDFPKKLESQLIPFVQEHKIQPRVILLDDPRENVWIPKVDSTWSGALPATLIFNKADRGFYERSFDKESLNRELEKFLNTAS